MHPYVCSKVLEDEEEAALEKEDQEREKEVLACNMLLLTCNYRGAAGKICSSSSNFLKKCSLAKKLWILSKLGTSWPNMSRHYQPISGWPLVEYQPTLNQNVDRLSVDMLVEFEWICRFISFGQMSVNMTIIIINFIQVSCNFSMVLLIGATVT